MADPPHHAQRKDDMKRNLFALLASMAVIFSAQAALAETSTYVAQEDAPLKVLAYRARYAGSTPKILHEVRYQNRAKAPVVSARFGFLEYNGYGERLDGFFGYAVEDSEPGEKDSVEFINQAPHAAMFEKVGGGYMWVDAVRFADGNVWKADRVQVLESLKKLNHEVTAVDLSEKKSLPAD
jgi:hypothetical protein